MVTIWKQNEKGLLRTGILESNCWMHLTAPTELEIETVEREYGIPRDVIQDILDPDERSRSEKEEDYHLIILRIPIYNPEQEVPYYTIPCGILLLPEFILSICLQENEILSDASLKSLRGLDLQDKPGSVLRVVLRSANYYLRYLKEINRRTASVERELQRSVKNNELVRLLNMEKSLVYFTTSLRSNGLLLEKLQKTLFNGNREAEMELYEDVTTENKQAIEMSNIYSNILSGMMDAFASVISNNQNVLMKRMTSISLILMIPTLVASIYGMNIHLPFQDSPLAFLGIISGCAVLSVAGIGLFLGKRHL